MGFGNRNFPWRNESIGVRFVTHSNTAKSIKIIDLERSIRNIALAAIYIYVWLECHTGEAMRHQVPHRIFGVKLIGNCAAISWNIFR